MGSYIVGGVIGLLIGFLAAKLVNARIYHKDVAQMLVNSLELEEAQAQALGKPSMIDHVVQTKGMDYAIMHYGNLYHILRGLPKKDEKLSQIENAIGLFLSDAMRDDLARYQKEHKGGKK